MKCNYFLSGFFLLFTTLMFVACKQEKPMSEDMLIGRWEIVEGARNGTQVESLADLYFEFFRDGRMRSNLPGASGLTSYEFKEGKILQTGGQIEPEYQVQELTDSTLLMTTVISKFNFRFLLAKKIQEN